MREKKIEGKEKKGNWAASLRRCLILVTICLGLSTGWLFGVGWLLGTGFACPRNVLEISDEHQKLQQILTTRIHGFYFFPSKFN